MFLRLSAFLLLISVTAITLHADNQSLLPQAKDSSGELFFFYPGQSGWMLTIFADGSANLQFGSTSGDSKMVPSGYFNYEDIRSSHLVNRSWDALSVKEQEEVCSLFKKAFSEGRALTELNPSRLEDLWQKNNPCQKQKNSLENMPKR